MKNEFKPKSALKSLCIPDEIANNTSLKRAEIIDTYSNPQTLLLLDRRMTARQIIHTVDMLNTVATGLIMRLERAAMLKEEQYRHICIPEELLEMAGIPKDVPLNISADEGEIYITIAEDEEDLQETFPSFLRELFEDCEVDFGALRDLLESEEPIHE